MATDLEKKAKEAFIDDHFELAVELYTQAIDLNPTNAELYADRAQANIKLSNFTGSLPLFCFSLSDWVDGEFVVVFCEVLTLQ